MLDEEFAKRLETLPMATDVVGELFSAARESSEARVFTAVVDVERWIHDGKKYLTCQMLNHWVVQQFAEYFGQVNIPIEKLPDKSMGNLFRRLQMLAYSQFWECHSIQRLLRQLVQIAEGKEYEPRLLMDNPPKTINIYEWLIAHAKGLKLTLAEFLTGVYSNQIRNAFAHSQFCVLGEYISLFNHNPSIDSHVPSLKLDTWERLFRITRAFIIAFFEARRGLERELISKTPYRVVLPEFGGPFNLAKDERGYWSARPVS